MKITASRIVFFTKPDRIVLRVQPSEINDNQDVFLSIGPGEFGYGKTYEEWMAITPPISLGIPE